MRTCVILGAGAQAREVYWLIINSVKKSFDSFVFVDDININSKSLNLDGQNWPIVHDWDFSEYISLSQEIGFIIGVGEPSAKVILVEKAMRSGLTPLPSIIHPSVIILDSACKIGSGGIIAPNCVLTTNIKISDFVLLNVGVSIGHDCILNEYVTCAPRVALAGNVVLEEGVNVGIGAVIREKIKVASFVTIGAQSCVVKDILDPRTTVKGVPARAFDKSSL